MHLQLLTLSMFASTYFVIELSQDVEKPMANLSIIKVVNMFGDEVGVDFEVAGNVVTVLPKLSYTQNIVYTLVVPADLKSTNGDGFGQGVHLKFIVNP